MLKKCGTGDRGLCWLVKDLVVGKGFMLGFYVIALCTVASAQNGIIFKKLITLVADVQKRHILYKNNLLHEL